MAGRITPVQKMAEAVFFTSGKGWTPHLIHILLGLWILAIFNIETFGKEIRVCFDRSKKGAFRMGGNLKAMNSKLYITAYYICCRMQARTCIH